MHKDRVKEYGQYDGLEQGRRSGMSREKRTGAFILAFFGGGLVIR